MQEVLLKFSEFVNCLNGLCNSKDLKDCGWKEHEDKFIPIWFQGEPLSALKKIETLWETSTYDVKLKRGDEFGSDYSENDDC